MEDKELAVIKGVLVYLKAARQSGFQVFHAMVDGEEFKSDVLIPLEKAVGWKESDEKIVDELTERLKKEAAGQKTIKEKSEALKKMIKMMRIGGVGLGIGITAYGLSKLAGVLSKKN